MGRLFNYDGQLMQSLNKITDCIILSFLWLLFSIPIITFGASTTALYYTANKVIRHNRSHVWREFWRSFKLNFKQSTIVWLILLVLIFVLGIDFIFLFNLIRVGKIASWMLAPFLVLAAFVVMWAIYVFAYIARFQNNLKPIMKFCGILVIAHLLRSLLLMIIYVVAVVLTLFIPIVICILPALTMLLMTFILEPIFKKYMSEEDLAAEEERNRDYY